MQLCKYVDLQILKYQLSKYESVEIFKYKCRYANISVYRYAFMHICRYTNMPLSKYKRLKVCKFSIYVIMQPCEYATSVYVLISYCHT